MHLALADLFVNRTRNATLWPSVSSSPSHPLPPNLEARVCDEAGAVRAICGKRGWERGRCGRGKGEGEGEAESMRRA